MILVDTSVWIDHLRRGNKRLVSLLHDEQVLCHPFVVGELACGNLENRTEVLGLLNSIPLVRDADHSEVLHFLNSNRLYGHGLGWVDVHLLASVLLTGCSIWTLDKSFLAVAVKLRLSYQQSIS
jgi:predicted nucleic acid-binding protein